jgi:hypothetical protein
MGASKSKLYYDRRSVGRSSWYQAPSGAQDQIFVTVRQVLVYWCAAPSLTRERVCRLQLLLVLASTVILGSESLGTHDHMLLSQIRDFLNLEGPGHRMHIRQEQGDPVTTPPPARRWVPFPPPPTTRRTAVKVFGPAFTRACGSLLERLSLYSLGTDSVEDTVHNKLLSCCASIGCRGDVPIQPLPSNGRLIQSSCHNIFSVSPQVL